MAKGCLLSFPDMGEDIFVSQSPFISAVTFALKKLSKYLQHNIQYVYMNTHVAFVTKDENIKNKAIYFHDGFTDNKRSS